MGKTKRKKKDDSDEAVTYINERNKVFNKKVSRVARFVAVTTDVQIGRYFDKYTKEYALLILPRRMLIVRIRDNFERGTAL